ncbi:MAG TPA: biopolymer transporter ExbD [Chthoniobacterales bacterium]|nr:biopolymer transporter ExbD [Chthoniobacterales bacterium]
MRVASPIPHKKARIEIIPLIDIMFFLLASFMMVSLSQTHMKGIRVNLPANQSLQPTQQKDFVSIRVAEGPVYYVENTVMNDDQEVMNRLAQLHNANPDLKVSLSAEMMAKHGDVIRVLDHIRALKITKVGYQIRAAQLGGSRVAPPPGGAAPPPPPAPPSPP